MQLEFTQYSHSKSSLQLQCGGVGGAEVVGGIMVGGVGIGVSVQNTLTTLDEQAAAVIEAAGTGMNVVVLAARVTEAAGRGVAITAAAASVTEAAGTDVNVMAAVVIVENGDPEEIGLTVSVGETSGTELMEWEGTIDDGLTSTHDRCTCTCVVILTTFLSVQIKSVVLG